MLFFIVRGIRFLLINILKKYSISETYVLKRQRRILRFNKFKGIIQRRRFVAIEHAFYLLSQYKFKSHCSQPSVFILFIKNCPNFLFIYDLRSFSQLNSENNFVNDFANGVLGIWTWDCRMEGPDESTMLWLLAQKIQIPVTYMSLYSC